MVYRLSSFIFNKRIFNSIYCLGIKGQNVALCSPKCELQNKKSSVPKNVITQSFLKLQKIHNHLEKAEIVLFLVGFENLQKYYQKVP